MIPFATEFPIKSMPTKAKFIAQVVAWLRGTEYSTVLDDKHRQELDSETAYLRSRSSEELRLREISSDNILEAIGFRHDFPDNKGRLWRTEAVVRRNLDHVDQDILRIRTQCIARELGAHLETPKKPYLVKMVLADDWGGLDGSLKADGAPHWLKNDGDSLALARDLTFGRASRYLPTIYVSATDSAHWQLSKSEIEKLAFTLGGIAHVVVEPDRKFSFLLRDETDGINVYDGTICIALPNQGIVRRYYLGWRLQTSSDLFSAVRSAAFAIRSQMDGLRNRWHWA